MIYLAGCFSVKAEEPLNQTRDLKISYGCGGHCNLCTLRGLCLFFNLNYMKLPLPDVFDEFIFQCVFSFSTKSVSLSHH